MNILDIIQKKRDNIELNNEEIKYFINGYTDGSVSDYQAAALIMAIFINGMTEQETTNLTLAMAESGEILDLSKLGKVIVDKHSTGGVGDKVSLVLLPLVASVGVLVAKMSGRGLGFTGGTVDKLESIPGYETAIDINSFVKNVENIGISMISQTLNLAPADKKIYALRDSISCVESIPLIASSIMSKKIASGAQKIVLDVTVGKGAFMKDVENAEKLSEEMIKIGKLAKRETVCILTNMDEPLGYAIGNSLEVIEAINFLKGENIPDLEKVVLELGTYMMKLSGVGLDLEENKKILLKNIKNGKAYNKFIELVENQCGDITYIKDTKKFESAKYIKPIYNDKEGYINSIDAKEVGKLACYLGAGRIKKEDEIQQNVGIVLNKKIGSKVGKNEIIGYIHSNNIDKTKIVEDKLKDVIKISENKVEPIKTIIKVIEE